MPGENIGIIPARGGSKGILLKNLRLLNDLPLVAYGILCSLKSPSIDRTIVSTDHDKIAEVAEQYGAEVIFRSPETATDEAPTEPAMKQVVRTLEENSVEVKNIALIQATCPFRLVADIEEGFGILKSGKGDAVMSVSPIPAHFHPYWLKCLTSSGHLASLYKEKDVHHDILETKRYWRRQDLPGAYYWKNGAIYIMNRYSLMISGHRYGEKCCPLVIEGDRLVNIDTEEDFLRAEKMLQEGKVILDFID
jgi:CMP-N,N'-diacetyllegionaminic acid synthase